MHISDSLEIKPNIIFLSVTKLNSTKAYTITIKNTHAAVIEHGFTSTLIAPDTNFPDFSLSNSPVLFLLQRMQAYARSQFNSRVFLVRALNFIIFEASFLSIVRLTGLIKHTDIIWARSFLAPIILGSKRKYLLEIHQPLSLWQKGLLLVQRLMGSSTVLAPISESLHCQVSDLPFKFKKVIKLPMAINRNFLNVSKPKTSPEFQIGFFGSLRMNSQSQGIFELIEQIIICRDFNPRFKCLMVGLGDAEIREVREYLADLDSSIDWISILPRVEHSLIPQLMQNCQYLIIPYPENKLNSARFPLKALEYGACFRTILASDTAGNRAIFSDDEVFFYDYKDRFSIQKSLKFIQDQPAAISVSKSMKVRHKAIHHSYFQRAKIALVSLDLI
jgi:hypothetical protein